VVPGIQSHAAFSFGTPLLIRVVEMLRFPGVSAGNVSLHPMAMAAWAGLLATAINLLPVGQLDGGHISYALLGERAHRILSLVVLCAMAVAGYLYWPWLVWAAALFFFRRHPLIYDHSPPDNKRCLLGAGAVLMFVLSISVVPVR
jgi:membrane-associated protease RseP (regulator of RpoE activity)